ncbi:MAG: hypothetical protein IJ087_19350 [Eggerthellaceae bacterium]|nr:hypothetical protein [Eggerthellaceae bacterium]
MFKAHRNTSACWNAPVILAIAVVVAVLVSLSGCGTTTEKSSFDAYSWDELSKISKEISSADSDEEGEEIAKSYHLLDSSGKLDGKAKSVALSDGTKASVLIAGIRQDDLASGGKAGITCMFADAPAAHAMNADSSNEGGWEKSEMRSWLNGEFEGMLPSDLKAVIVAANKKTNSSAYTSPGAVSTTADNLWLPSLVELSGSVAADATLRGSGIPAGTYNAEGKQYQLFAEKGVSAGEENSVLVRVFVGDDSLDSGLVVKGEACPCWERSLSTTWTSGFEATDADGDPLNAWITDYQLGVAPGFCL